VAGALDDGAELPRRQRSQLRECHLTWPFDRPAHGQLPGRGVEARYPKMVAHKKAGVGRAVLKKVVESRLGHQRLRRQNYHVFVLLGHFQRLQPVLLAPEIIAPSPALPLRDVATWTAPKTLCYHPRAGRLPGPVGREGSRSSGPGRRLSQEASF